MGVVVRQIKPTVHAAYQAVAGTLPASITSVYKKLNGLELTVTRALVRHAADRPKPVIVAMGGQKPPLVPGCRVRILDGNHLAATQPRLEALRGSVSGPLPGHALVVLEPALMLATHMIPCEDGYAQERSLSSEILALVESADVWIADRNFCTSRLLRGIAESQGFSAIRQHAHLTIESAGELRRCGRTETGEVYEQSVTVSTPDAKSLKLRRIVLRLDKRTRDGNSEIAILTCPTSPILADLSAVAAWACASQPHPSLMLWPSLASSAAILRRLQSGFSATMRSIRVTPSAASGRRPRARASWPRSGQTRDDAVR